jgi:hypothetical protein
MTSAGDGRLRRYLLRDLAEAETEEVEREAFAGGEEPFADLLEAEDDLIDDYAAGRLDPRDRELFAAAFLQTPERRRRVAFAEAARAASGGPTRAAPAARPRGWLPLAAAALLALATAVLAVRGAVLERRVRALAAENAADRERARRLEQELAAGRAAPASAVAAPRVAAYLLAAGGLRDPEARPPLRVGADTEAVVMRAPLDGSEAYSAYGGVLRTVEGREVWRDDSLRPPAPEGRTVSMVVPAGRLPRGDYILTVTGRRPSRAPVELAEFYLRVAGE